MPGAICRGPDGIHRPECDRRNRVGEVLDGTRPVVPDATVVFDSIGMACEDVAAATLVYERLVAEVVDGAA